MRTLILSTFVMALALLAGAPVMGDQEMGKRRPHSRGLLRCPVRETPRAAAPCSSPSIPTARGVL